MGPRAIARVLATVEDMTRVWLSGWEWSCCGDSFAVGDDVDFGIETRTPTPELVDALGAGIAATIGALESHHESEFTDRVRGRAVAIHAVSQEVVERRSLRRPGHGAPLTATMPPDGEEWPMRRQDLGNGVFIGSRPSRYVIEHVPVPGSALVAPARGVRVPESGEDQVSRTAADTCSDPAVDRRMRSLAGWLVDVEER